MKNHYATLGLSPDADAVQIERAYTALVRLHDPALSRSPQAETERQAIREAFEVLSDPNRRRDYDQELAMRRAYRAGSPRSPAAAVRRGGAPSAGPSASRLADPRQVGPSTEVPSIERGERVVHFGCGALFGGIVAAAGAARAMDASTGTVVVAALLGAIGTGAAAALLKNVFWDRIGRGW